jgi:acyl carrier protein
MSEEEILKQLNGIFRSVFDDNDITINKNTTANNIEAWDSLNHIHLMASIEKHFKIKFKAIEVQEFKDAGEICKAIFIKIKKR